VNYATFVHDEDVSLHFIIIANFYHMQ